jgi:hypothetical protein
MRLLRLGLFAMLALIVLKSSHCKFPYSMAGGRPELNSDTITVSVLTFVNSAPLAKATLPQTFSEALRDGIQRQTRLKMVPKNGDLNYEGTITNYTVTPVAIQGGGDNNAALNRLTITVNVKYTDGVDDKYSFDASFTRYADYASSRNLSEVEDQLITEITEQLVQDIINRSVNAW